MTEMLFLSRLQLNPRSREVRRDLANCQALHRRLLAAFPQQSRDDTGARAEFGLLYRVETNALTGAVTVLVQAERPADWAALPPDYLLAAPGAPKPVTETYQGLQDGQRLRFRLRANPTKCVARRDRPDEAKGEGKRVELRRAEDQIAWLRRKAQDGGFELRSLQLASAIPNTQVQPAGKVYGWRADGSGQYKKLTLAAVVFEGEIVVTDAGQFQQTLRQGIGRGKAYGFGLLSIARAAD